MVIFAKATSWSRGARKHITVDWSLSGIRGKILLDSMNRYYMWTLQIRLLQMFESKNVAVVKKWCMEKVSVFHGFILGVFYEGGNCLVLKIRGSSRERGTVKKKLRAKGIDGYECGPWRHMKEGMGSKKRAGRVTFLHEENGCHVSWNWKEEEKFSYKYLVGWRQEVMEF